VLIAACVKLEQVGDIIVRNLLVQVQKKVDRGLEFTGEGWSELVAFHSTVLANARLAFNVLVSRDRETAWQLVREKEPAARPRETLEPEPFRAPALLVSIRLSGARGAAPAQRLAAEGVLRLLHFRPSPLRKRWAIKKI
jgi:hypothetical protein